MTVMGDQYDVPYVHGLLDEIKRLEEQLEATEQRLAREISEHADAQAEYRRLVEQLEAAQEELRENDRLVERAWQERDDETEKAKRAEEQFEALHSAVFAFASEISEPTFDDSRIEWVEVQVDRESLAAFRALASNPAKRPS